jgi:hypothetical protein
MIEIDYEILVTNLECESRRLISFLGLEWDPACLDFHKNKRAVATASYWQVRQPIYDSSIGRWRHFESELQPMLKILSEPPSDRPDGTSPRYATLPPDARHPNKCAIA